jgi:CDP-diglyceride synthetase
MKNELDARRVAYASALIAGIFSIVCLAIIAIFGNSGTMFMGYIFHGLDISKIAVTNISWGGSIIGVIEVILIAFIGGWFFAKVYNVLT